jgi:hypothetical protein
MTKVGKTLIAVLVAADLGFVFYIMSPQSDHSTRKSDAATDGSVKMAVLDPGASGGTQVAAGAIANEMPASAPGAGRIAAAPPRPVAVPNVLVESGASAASVAKAPRVSVRQQPVKTVDVTNPHKPADTKASQPSRSEQASDDGRSGGANPVAAAMTEALVKQSAQLDPSLPPPDMSKSVSMHDVSDSSPRGGANPVAAAMTEQLVRESSRINSPGSPVHSSGQPGTP